MRLCFIYMHSVTSYLAPPLLILSWKEQHITIGNTITGEIYTCPTPIHHVPELVCVMDDGRLVWLQRSVLYCWNFDGRLHSTSSPFPSTSLSSCSSCSSSSASS